MEPQESERVIRCEVTVPASVNEVWHAWATEEGIVTFFAPACNVELRVDGPYEIFFNPEAELGQRGAEGMRVMAFQPERMLAFTWSAPPHLPQVRGQLTHVIVRMAAIDAGHTWVTLAHDGWGEGTEWDAAFAYFTRAWRDVVLPRLAVSFSVGAVDWDNPPRVMSSV